MISKEMLKEILLDQRKWFEEEMKSDFVPREKMDAIKEFARIKHNIIITGIRRSGKSVFLSQIAHDFFDKYYYVNFEDERLALFRLDDFSKLYEVCVELFGENKIFFLDEIQNISEWERWVRRMYDNGFKFFITGSNARLLSKELATLLTGRHIQITIFPFSFKEFLRFNKVEFKKEDIYLPKKRAIISKHFFNYAKKGGFPEYLKYGRIEILQECFNDIIQRDVVERYGVKDAKHLKDLARYLITNTGKMATYNKLKKMTEINSVNTIIKYFSYLENSYIVFAVPYFSYSLKKQIMNPFKVYSIDIGMRNAIGFRTDEETGRVYETIVAIELKRRNKDVYYWKNHAGREVDFVIKNGLKVIELIQVCYDVSDANTKEREIDALIKASEELRCSGMLVITDDFESEEKHKGKKIKFMPLWKWLLS